MAVEKKRILVVDDEANVRESLKLILSREYDTQLAENGARALELLSENSNEDVIPALVLLDVMMPGIDGLGVLEKVKSLYPELPVIMLTASTAVKSAVQAMKIGAVDYLSKPYDVDELLSLIDECISCGANGRNAPSRTVVHDVAPIVPDIEGDFGFMVGQHPLIKEVYAKIDQIATRDTTILITGESGTGKEIVAREIHRRSPRSKRPFIAINCAAIPESLIESELFGHEKGAFTHAVEKRLGHFEMADGGTLFLDEIGELSLNVQVKILRFLQEREFYRVGASKPIRVDVRVLTATNRSLETAIKEGRFRQDLFYRINVVSLDIPPLRKRREDIPLLISHFVARMAPLYGCRNIKFSDEALKIICDNPWPGNVRELENVTESILALTNCELITDADLPHRFRQPSAEDMKAGVASGAIAFEDAEKAFETELITRALEANSYVQTKAAEMLGISRRILKYKMDKLGIVGPKEE